MAVLKLLRNATAYANYNTAKAGLVAKMASLGNGEIAIATYEVDGSKKTLFGIKNLDVVTYFDTQANTDELAAAINELDATVEGVSSDGHVTVNIVEGDGKLTNVTVTTDDIASATDLTSEIAARKAVDGQNGQTYTANSNANYIASATSLNDADVKLDTALKTADDAMLTGVSGSDAVTVSTKANKNQTVTLKLDTTTKSEGFASSDNALSITVGEGLYLSSVWDCGSYN